MRHLAVVALLVVGIALPACAQRGMSRGGSSGHGGSSGGSSFHGGFSGGSSGHSAPAFRGGSGASAPSRFAGGTRYAGPVRPGVVRGIAPRNSNYNYGARRPGNPSPDRYRRPYRSPYGAGYPYGFAPFTGWADPYLSGYTDDSGYDDSGASQNYAGDAYNDPYGQQPPEQEQQAPNLPYQYSSSGPSASARPAPESEEAVTLVFKDGRVPEQIHNYMLSRTTLSVLDKHHQEIPVDELDLAATAKVNRDAGVDFHLPGDSK
jgi:hypothetical protein